MSELQSYTQILEQLISPTTKVLLSAFFDNFDDFYEKAKNPESSERKVLNTINAIIACTMLTEKQTKETQELHSYLEELNKKDEEIEAAKPIEFNEIEEEQEEAVDVNRILAGIDNRLAAIQEQKNILQEEFNENMEELKEQESDMLDEIFDDYDIDGNYKIDFYGDEPMTMRSKIIQLYEQREQQRPERLAKLQKMVEVHSTNEFVGAVINAASAIKGFVDDLGNNEQQKISRQRERDFGVQEREAERRLEKGLLKEKETVKAGHRVGTSIQLVGLLRKELSEKGYSMNVLTELASRIDAQEDGFILLKNGLKENYDKTIKNLDEEAEKIKAEKNILTEKNEQKSKNLATPELTPEQSDSTKELDKEKENKTLNQIQPRF